MLAVFTFDAKKMLEKFEWKACKNGQQSVFMITNNVSRHRKHIPLKQTFKESFFLNEIFE